MNALDKWSAEQCGIIYSKRYKDYGIPDPINTDFQIKWTMTDARCREVAAEYFKISHVIRDFKRLAFENKWRLKDINDSEGKMICLSGRGKTIAEAEIACLQAIMDSTR